MVRKLLAGLIALVAVFVFSTTLAHALLDAPESDIIATNTTNTSQDTEQLTSTHTAAPGDYPVRLQIPSLGIDANVQYVGITAHATMAVPNNFTDVGWYKYGPVPGSSGSAVMAGHVDNALALPGVFKHLQDIQQGEDIYVLTKDGNKQHFVVDEVDIYNVNDVPTSRVFETSGSAHLNLITCDGTWVQSQKQYDQRLVVYSHLSDQ
jgi:LPXTG-site transpeptidase (sortase) family protein